MSMWTSVWLWLETPCCLDAFDLFVQLDTLRFVGHELPSKAESLWVREIRILAVTVPLIYEGKIEIILTSIPFPLQWDLICSSVVPSSNRETEISQ